MPQWNDFLNVSCSNRITGVFSKHVRAQNVRVNNRIEMLREDYRGIVPDSRQGSASASQNRRTRIPTEVSSSGEQGKRTRHTPERHMFIFLRDLCRAQNTGGYSCAESHSLGRWVNDLNATVFVRDFSKHVRQRRVHMTRVKAPRAETAPVTMPGSVARCRRADFSIRADISETFFCGRTLYRKLI